METRLNWQQVRKAYFDTPLSPLYELDERKAMWQWWCESRLGIGLQKQSSWQFSEATDSALELLQTDVSRLLAGEPFQYVINEAWFLNKRFVLNGNVLIPRPETEELVLWMLNELDAQVPWRIADMGTGSGIIPISLQLARPNWLLWGIDLSSDALATAKQNAAMHKVEVSWLTGDMCSVQLPDMDVIVSNPPYIPLDQAHTLHPRVSNHEPSMALFSPETDALFFYRCLAGRFKEMGSGKQLFLELNHEKATEIGGLFEGMKLTFKADMQGKARMLRVES